MDLIHAPAGRGRGAGGCGATAVGSPSGSSIPSNALAPLPENRPFAATGLLSIQMHNSAPYTHVYIHTGSAPGTYNHAVQSCARSVSVSVRVHKHCLARFTHIIHLPLQKGRDPNEQELVVIMSRLNELSKIPAPASGTAALLGGLTARAGIARWRIVLVWFGSLMRKAMLPTRACRDTLRGNE